MRVLSLGAGVQSSTLFLMACEGEEPIDAAIFADTGWEPQAVYDWLEVLEEHGKRAGIPIYRVSGGNIREDTLREGRRFASLPAYVLNPDGNAGMGRRQCTKEYKLRPVQRQVKALGATARKPAHMLIGISLDEYQRARDSWVKYIVNEFPLIARRITRADCLAWLERHGYPEPTKSACVGCPFRRDAEWRRLTPAEFADAVEFDRAIRTPRNGFRGEQFLHRSLVPLDMVDLRSEQDRGQMELDFDGCGVLCPAEDAA